MNYIISGATQLKDMEIFGAFFVFVWTLSFWHHIKNICLSQFRHWLFSVMFWNLQSAPCAFYSNMQTTWSFRFIMVGNKLVCQQNLFVSHFISKPYLSTFLYIMFALQFCEHLFVWGMAVPAYKKDQYFGLWWVPPSYSVMSWNFMNSCSFFSSWNFYKFWT